MPLTGNDFIAVPDISDTGAIRSINVLSMKEKGLIELKGDPFITPSIYIDGKIAGAVSFIYREYWIPEFRFSCGKADVVLTILTPHGHKGFCMAFSVTSRTDDQIDAEIRFGVNLSHLVHTVNESKEIEVGKKVRKSSWEDDFMIETFIGTPFLCFAAMGENASSKTGSDNGFTYVFSNQLTAGGQYTGCMYFGIAFEEVGAVTVCRELLRWGYDRLLMQSVKYIGEHTVRCEDPAYSELLNRNLLFAMHYSLGITFDSEELVCITSRSPHYYVSAAYWDRDSLLWSFPAIARIDISLARRVLDYVVQRQARNTGVHSRYIDGSVLEPGFELDELVSPVIALDTYLGNGGDRSILEEREVMKLIDKILSELEKWKDEKTGLYATFLQPTDDMAHYSFLLYDNALVIKAFRILATLFSAPSYAHDADVLHEQCMKYFNVEGEYVWAVDGNGNYDIYDEPPGSLILLPYYGFCTVDDPAYGKTVERINDASYEYSFSGCSFAAVGCAHAPHPWVLSLINEFKVFRSPDALDKLLKAPMDERIACESIDENTGEVATGRAFATCAGFLACALMEALDER